MAILAAIVCLICFSGIICAPATSSFQSDDDTINLSGLRLTSVPKNLSENAVNLIIMDNDIKNISKGALKRNLRYLNLAGNRFQTSDDLREIEAARNLELLDLSNNQIMFFNPEILRLNSKLKVLILDNNQGVELYGRIPNLPALEELSMRNCGLPEIPTDFSGTPNVKILDFRGNPVLNISTNTIESLFHSVELKFDDCPYVSDRNILNIKNITLTCRMPRENSKVQEKTTPSLNVEEPTTKASLPIGSRMSSGYISDNIGYAGTLYTVTVIVLVIFILALLVIVVKKRFCFRQSCAGNEDENVGQDRNHLPERPLLT